MIGLQYGLVWKCWNNSIPFMGYIIIMFASSRVAIFWIVPHFQTPKWLSQKWSNMQIPWFGRLANGCETQDIGCCSLRTTCWRIAILLPCFRHDFESSWALPENWWELMKIGCPWTGWFSFRKKSCHFGAHFQSPLFGDMFVHGISALRIVPWPFCWANDCHFGERLQRLQVEAI